MPRRLRSRHARLGKAELSLTPLIDTALTLLIIFMVAAPMLNRNAIKVTLPDGSAQEAENTKQELVVHVDKNGTIFFDDTKMTLDQLLTKLKQKVGSSKNQTVFVCGDKGGLYGDVIKIVDQIKVVGGVDYVALAMQNPKKT